ncbi:hypothetical protein QCN29_32385 [Streptomyces sp. HNM0663]|uniref:Uncharacterized protein n=1 Tax=Streptomyces chengmaiensis TaxID=3040919 RepID=A0ABT6HXF1_9ACTN|nr:hypothetical protein [Streptomyces chengmaiensis]MDH2393382.1 hypothetical protein [Streptomyces chengmaiensis]
MTSTPPSPEIAYATAPPLHLEADELMRLRRAQAIGDREWLLRYAALSDRQTLGADPADGKAQTAALRPIQKLIDFDTEHGTTAGPVAPDDAQWADFPRGYVRQEYLAWQDEQGADIAQILPRRRSDGELYVDERPL